MRLLSLGPEGVHHIPPRAASELGKRKTARPGTKGIQEFGAGSSGESNDPSDVQLNAGIVLGPSLVEAIGFEQVGQCSGDIATVSFGVYTSCCACIRGPADLPEPESLRFVR